MVIDFGLATTQGKGLKYHLKVGVLYLSLSLSVLEGAVTQGL